MALIGEMDYLTIGGNTYSIPKYSLPIASASTLGGVRVGTGLTIESGTGILSATGTDVTIDSEMSDSSHNPVQNQTIKAYIDQYKGTVTSVRVQATSPVQSSASTAQSETLDTTISLANGYGDTKNPYGTKTANYVLAGPTTGTATAPTFRKLVVADIPDLSETYLTSYTETDPTVPSWAKASTKPSYTASEVGAASSSHTHGNITNGGDITATAPTIANGDQIIINDNSASKITNGPTFDGSTTTTALTPKGTWESFSKFSGNYNDLSNKPTIPTVPTAVSAFTNDAGYITSADVPEGASAYTGTISAVSTTASNGTNNGFARGDHVHNITSSTITSALGYTPYDSTNPNGYISSYTDEKLKWTASTTSNTYYPLQSTSTATTSTANTLNGISFYQYYNTAGGYRRLDLGNSTAYKSTGGAYGTIRLYGAAATYYGDLVPGVLGTTSGDGHISANRTWTLPDKTGTIALTSDIPTTLPASDVSAWAKESSKPTYTASEVGALASDTTYVSTVTTTAGTHTAISNKSGAVSFNVPTNTSHLTNDSGFITSYTDTKNTAGSTDTSSKIFLIGATSQAANPQTYSHDTAYVGTDGCLYSGGSKVLTAHQDISGKVDTAGTGLSKSGTTLNHTNSVTAQTTQAIYPIKIDAQGHISAYGSAVTPLTASSSLNAAKLTGTIPSDCYTNTTYSAGTGLSLSSNSFSIKLGYTTSGNNRAVQADESGNLYVVQKDDNNNTFKSFYGTCSTAAATAAKVVTLSVTTGWQLAAGTVVGVKFTNTNTFSATADSHVTLNVNSTGAKNIYYGTGLPTGTNTTAFGRANYINYYMYDGSQWVWLSSSADNNTTYYLQTYTTRQTNADAAWHSNSYIKYLLATSSMTTNKPTFTGDGVAKRTSDGMILHLSWDNNGGWDTQIAIPNSGGMISTRGGSGLENDTQKWTDWVSYARADKAISNITRSGTTFTATRADGTTFTFTQQDNNTTALTSMTGTLAIGHGGTGQTTAVNAANALIDALDTATANWTDNTLVLTSDVSGDTNVYYKRAATSAWNYIINKVYPVGAIYMSVNSTNPGTLFGGTWVAWGTGRVPVGINTSDTDFKTVEKTGGAKTVTLDLANVGAVNASTEASGFGLTATSAFQNRVVVSTSSATSHSNLQPYITCYMWKRTA